MPSAPSRRKVATQLSERLHLEGDVVDAHLAARRLLTSAQRHERDAVLGVVPRDEADHRVPQHHVRTQHLAIPVDQTVRVRGAEHHVGERTRVDLLVPHRDVCRHHHIVKHIYS